MIFDYFYALKLPFMKRIHNLSLLMVLALLAVSCHKDPPKTYDDTDMTVTYYNPDFGFGAYSTFIMPDSTVLKTNVEDFDVEYFYREGQASDQMLSMVRDRFISLGYQEVEFLEDADFIALPTLLMVQSDQTVWYNPGWWWGYPGYGWGIGIGFGFAKSTDYYWGWWYPAYPWYPGYPVAVSTYTGTVVVEMVDAASYREVLAFNELNPEPDPEDDPPQLEINWQAYIEGYATDDGEYNQERAMRGLDEAMAQSPYLNK